MASNKEEASARRRRSITIDLSLKQLTTTTTTTLLPTLLSTLTLPPAPPAPPALSHVSSDELTAWEQLPFHDATSRAADPTNAASEPKSPDVSILARAVRRAVETHRIPDETTVECCICYEGFALPPSTPPSLHGANPCGSANIVCRSCALSYLQVKVAERAVGPALACPGGCGEVLTAADVQAFLAPARSGNEAGSRALLAQFNEAHGAAAAVATARDRRLRRWLPSASDVAEDLQFALWRWERDAQRCPGCKIGIEKNGGCQHMTCRGCRHEFWWCCGQAFKPGCHNEMICAPITGINFLSHHPSRYWGPTLPVRAVAKVTAFGVAVGLVVPAAAVAIVAVPLYLGCSKLGKKLGLRDWRRRRAVRRQAAAARAATQRHFERAAAARAAREQHEAEGRRRLARDLQSGLSHLPEAAVEVTVEDIASLKAAPAYVPARPCSVCASKGFRRPQDLLHHVALHASGALPLAADRPAGAAAEALLAEMRLTRLANGCAVFAALECATEDGADVALARNELEDLRCFNLELRHPKLREPRHTALNQERCRAAAAAASAAGQRCLCGVEPPSLEAWCAHLARRNPRRAARVARAPAACGVTVRPGVLCACRGCVAPGVVCAGCLHPRMLHHDTARGNPRPVDQNQGNNSHS